MPALPSWQGHLRLSLVTCPVALYPATSEAETVYAVPTLLTAIWLMTGGAFRLC